MYTANIKPVTKETHQETGEMFLDVEFDILKDGEVAVTRKLGFALDTAPEDITAAVAAQVALAQQEDETLTKNADFIATQEKADKTIEALADVSVSADGTVEKTEDAAPAADEPAQ